MRRDRFRAFGSGAVEAAGVDGGFQRWNAGVGAVDGVDHDGFVLLQGAEEDFASHQLAAGDLSFLQRDGEVDIVVGEDVAFGQIALGVDAAQQSV